MPTAYILDDDEALCESLAFLLDSVNIQNKIFDSPFTFLNEYNPNDPGCLLLDIRMPKMNGLCLQDKLIKMNAPLPIIFMTGHGDIHMAVNAMKKGAVDFFVKPFDHQTLLKSIQKGFNSYDKKSFAEKQAINFSQITEQEESIIQKIITGASSKQIANELALSIKTIEYHRTKIFRKLGVKSVAELTRAYMLYNRHA